MIVTLDSMVCSDFPGANNMSHSLADRAVMVTLDRMGCSSVGIESPMLVNGTWMVTSSDG
jgi:hypothetical protein